MIVKPSSQSGFSLVEVALVMIIGGILLSLFSGTLITMISGAKMKTTQERMNAINEALQIYATANNRLPCAASRTIAVTAAANYGREVAACTGAQAGTVTRPGANGGNVRIGFVPTRTLNLPDETGYDAWGSRIMYAVSENLTAVATYDLVDGRIRINDSLGTEVTTGSNATYAIFSVGPDRRGGYNTLGAVVSACAVPAPRADISNCDDADGIFVATMMTGSTDDANHYDDFLTYEGNFQSSIIPAGALMAFDRAECPSGWTEHVALQGRFLVGRGTFTEPSNPPNLTAASGNEQFDPGETGGWASRLSVQSAASVRVNNLPPYAAYLYCRKN